MRPSLLGLKVATAPIVTPCRRQRSQISDIEFERVDLFLTISKIALYDVLVLQANANPREEPSFHRGLGAFCRAQQSTTNCSLWFAGGIAVKERGVSKLDGSSPSEPVE